MSSYRVSRVEPVGLNAPTDARPSVGCVPYKGTPDPTGGRSQAPNRQQPANLTRLLTDRRMLELLAIDCHRVGSTWAAFWREHSERVAKAEPCDRGRYRRLVARLLSLVVSGDTAGQQGIGDDDTMPWETDDQPMGPPGRGPGKQFPTVSVRIEDIVHPSTNQEN